MHDSKNNDQFIQLALLTVIIFAGIIIFYLSVERFFNFDEFDVVYAGSSFLRGKLLYSDKLGTHFPFTDLSVAFFTSILGMKTTTLIGIRVIFFFVLCLTLYFVYRIGGMIRNNETGLIAVALTITSIAFMKKGIEIRHDVFNMFFNTMGVFFVLQYMTRMNYRYLVFGGLSCGLALASTQKSIMWISGIYLGFTILLIRENGIKQWLKCSLIYLSALLIPISLCLFLIIFHFHESIDAFLSQTIVKQFGYFFPNINKHYSVLPFPHSKAQMWKKLLLDNSLLYLTGLVAGVIYLVKRFKKLRLEIIPLFWLISGLTFYLFMKRTFYQSFLPTIPAFGLLCSFLFFDIKKLFHLHDTYLKRTIYFFLLFAFLIFPTLTASKQALLVNKAKNQKTPIASHSYNNKKHLDNLAFCLANLGPNEKVLCFTQQQVFFDPLLQFTHNVCGETIRGIDKRCLIDLMKKENCRVVIFDFRTTLLKKNILKQIFQNYLYSGIGDILIPGFKIYPGKTIHKEIWIPGAYDFPPGILEIDGHINSKGRMEFNNRIYTFKNVSNKPIHIAYHFIQIK